jgi:tetratricopeptide (TPR) repeat protein
VTIDRRIRHNDLGMMPLMRRSSFPRRAGTFLSVIGLALAPPLALAQPTANDERAALAASQPAPLEAHGHATRTPVVALRFRFYADDDHRAGAGDLSERLAQVFASLNRITEGALGVRFAIESVRPWHRASARGPLVDGLDQLEKLDPAGDVDWVVGLIGGRAQISSDIHEVGTARTLGRHFVMRAMGSLGERAAFARTHPALDRTNPADLELTFTRRTRHKEAVVFLHEWAHTLGALHVADPTRILSPTYTTDAGVLGPMEVGLLNAALDDRLGNERREWKHLRRFLAQAPAGDWDPRDRARLDAVLGGGASAAGDGTGEALAGDAGPLIAAARTALSRRDVASAQLHAAAATLRAGHTSDPATWLAIAQIDLQLGALTWAEQALARVAAEPAVSGLGAQAQHARRFHGLPAHWPGIAPDQEPAFVAAFTQADAALMAPRSIRARSLIEAGLQRFSGAPGWLMLACDLALRESRNKLATDQCTAALAAMEELPRAHFLLGTMALAAGKTAAALTSLRRAVDLDPSQTAYWEALGEVHGVLGRDDEFRKLRAERTGAVPAPRR